MDPLLPLLALLGVAGVMEGVPGLFRLPSWRDDDEEEFVSRRTSGDWGGTW